MFLALKAGPDRQTDREIMWFEYSPAASSQNLGRVAGCGVPAACVDASSWATRRDLHSETV